MAAPSIDRPVTVTIGTVWNFQVRPPPPRPPRVSVEFAIISVAIIVSRIIFGAVYFRDCPQQPNIPIYLLLLALAHLLLTSFVTLPCESDSRGYPRGIKGCLMSLVGPFIFIWIFLGNVWIFSIYQPNYDPTAADGLYCNKTLYTFAFWNAIYETFGIGVALAKFCKGMLVYVVMSPVPTNTNVYGHV